MLSIQKVARSAAITLIALLTISAFAGCSPSTSTRYAFSTTTPEVSGNATALVDVRIVHQPSGKVVENAVIFETRLDMSPDSMEGMTAPVTPEGSPEPGVYRFAIAPTMAGRWQLKLSAKIQGEPDTVTGSVIVTVR